MPTFRPVIATGRPVELFKSVTFATSKPATSNWQQATSKWQHATSKWQLATVMGAVHVTCT